MSWRSKSIYGSSLGPPMDPGAISRRGFRPSKTPVREALSGAHLDSKLRAEIARIADMLQGNLDKVVQHGKRADAIVKNMLLHSRQGSGEHRPVDINALVEESLNLAYHGARAEKQDFTITLERSLIRLLARPICSRRRSRGRC